MIMAKWILFGLTMIPSLAHCSAVSDAVGDYVSPPQISYSEIADVSDPSDLAYKIHGKNGGSEKFKCKSFEKDLEVGKRRDALKYGYFSSFSYRGTSEEVLKEMSTATLEAQGYTQLSTDVLQELLKGTSLEGDDNGIWSKDESKRNKDNKKMRFDAKIFVKQVGDKTEVVIAYRGTQMTNAGDWWDDVKQAANPLGNIFVQKQYKQASELLAAVLTSESFKGASIVCTGHSLGGGLVTYAMASNDLQNRVTGYTYDAAGLSEQTLKSIEDVNLIKDASQHIINVRATKDPVSYIGYHLGPMYEVRLDTDKVVENHSLERLIKAMENNVEPDDPFDAPPETNPSSDGAGATSTGGQPSSRPPSQRRNGGSIRGGGGNTSCRF